MLNHAGLKLNLAFIQKKIVIGCIYRHPKANIEIFTDQLNELLRDLNHQKCQFFILGDGNIDFLRYLNHQPTEKYLGMLYTDITIPVIAKPTRITNHTKTLIDHICTNTCLLLKLYQELHNMTYLTIYGYFV